MLDLTDDQWARLDALKPVETSTEVVNATVATIGAPWATDANGASLASRYEVDGLTVTQRIETNDDTAFPVTADPSVWWWVGTVALCVAEISALFLGGAAVVAKLAKAEKLIKASKQVLAAYKAVGGTMANLLKQMRKFVKNRSSLSKSEIRAIENFMRLAGSTVIVGFLGLGGCWDIYREVT